MPTSQTRVTVSNLALDIVADLPIQTMADDRPEAKWLNRNFDHVVETALRANLWAFATERHRLNADGGYDTSTDLDWGYRYSWPNGALRLVPPTYLGQRGGQPIPYAIRRNSIYLSQPAPFRADFVMSVLEPGQWDPLFTEVVAASLAARMAQRFTRKTSFLQLAMKMKDDAVTTAQEVGAFESGMEPIEQYDIIRARGDYL